MESSDETSVSVSVVEISSNSEDWQSGEDEIQWKVTEASPASAARSFTPPVAHGGFSTSSPAISEDFFCTPATFLDRHHIHRSLSPGDISDLYRSARLDLSRGSSSPPSPYHRALSEPPPEDFLTPPDGCDDGSPNHYGSVETLPASLPAPGGAGEDYVESGRYYCQHHHTHHHEHHVCHHHRHQLNHQRPHRRIFVGGSIPIRPVRIRSRSISELISNIRQPLPVIPKHPGGDLSRRASSGRPEKRRSGDDELSSSSSSVSSSSSEEETSTLPVLSPKQKLTLLASIAIVNFTSFCCVSVLAPFYPREVAAKELSNAVSGAVFALYALMYVLFAPVMGIIVPYVGTKFMFLAGSFLSGGCCVLFGFLHQIQDPTVFVVFSLLIRGIEALGAAAFQTAAFTFCVLYFPDNIGSVIGLMETFVGLGLSVGPALGGFLYSLGGFSLPFVILGVILLASVPLNAALLPSDQLEGSVTTSFSSFLSLISHPPVMAASAAIVVSACCWTYLDPLLEPHLRIFDLSPAHLGLVFLLISGTYAIFSPIWGWVGDKLSGYLWSLVSLGLVSSGTCLLFLGPSPLLPFLDKSLSLILGTLAVLGCTIALSTIPTYQLLDDSTVSVGLQESEVGIHSLVSGLWVSMYSLGECIGPALGGYLMDAVGFEITSTIFGGICIVFGSLGLLLTAPWRKCLGGKIIKSPLPYTSVNTEIGVTTSSELGGSSTSPSQSYKESSPLLDTSTRRRLSEQSC